MLRAAHETATPGAEAGDRRDYAQRDTDGINAVVSVQRAAALVPSAGTIFKLKVDMGLHCGCDAPADGHARDPGCARPNRFTKNSSKDKHDESHERTKSVQEIWQQERQASAFQEDILMIGLLIIGIGGIAGIMLGLRFKILILVPAILLATAAITVTGIVSGYEAKAVALTVFGTAASLQVGYIAACILYVVVLALLPARTATRYRGPRVAPRAEPR